MTNLQSRTILRRRYEEAHKQGPIRIRQTVAEGTEFTPCKPHFIRSMVALLSLRPIISLERSLVTGRLLRPEGRTGVRRSSS